MSLFPLERLTVLIHHTIMYSLTEIAFKRNLELSLKKRNLINNHVFLLITF